MRGVCWNFIPQPLGTGLGNLLACRPAEDFLSLTDLCAEDKTSIALGMYCMYALHWTVQFLRHHPESTARPDSLPKLYLTKAHGGSKAGALLPSYSMPFD